MKVQRKKNFHLHDSYKKQRRRGCDEKKRAMRIREKNSMLCVSMRMEKKKKEGNFMELLNSPKPIAAQHSTVTIDSVTLRLVMECAGRGFRSQHRDIK